MGLAKKKQLIRGLRFTKDLTTSRLIFADDSLIFSKASTTDCKHLKEVFDYYAKASGHIFNFDKSSMFFSDRVSEG